MTSTEITSSCFSELECSMCSKKYPKDKLASVCSEKDCGKPLLARYDLQKAAATMTKESLATRESTLWRYEEVLPVLQKKNVFSLGEGWTPLLHAKNLGKELKCPNLYIKDESLNPTGSFKARGLSVAVCKAVENSVTGISLPSAGNAAGATAAYCAVAGLPVRVFMPKDVPPTFPTECKMLGAEVQLVDGLIHDCGAAAAQYMRENEGYFALSTLKEPYRIEGKKTMGYEIAEQFDFELPDVIIYPTGGGTGMVGMWKAFEEMETMGLIGSKRPRMVVVQAETCAPIVKAFKEGAKHAPLWENASTIADGLRVPVAIGDFLILAAVRDSDGTALTVSDEEMRESCKLMGKTSGIWASPEGGAVAAAAVKLINDEWIRKDDKVVLFNTGSGVKYLNCFVD